VAHHILSWHSIFYQDVFSRLFKVMVFMFNETVIGDRLLQPCYLGTDDHNQKIRTKKQRTDVGTYSFVNRTIKCWNQLPAGLLASFPCKLNTFRKTVKNVVTSKGIQVGIECK
jgi:hypothetical protein